MKWKLLRSLGCLSRGRRLGAAALLLVAFLALAGTVSPAAGARTPLRVGDPPPAVSLPDLAGHSLRIPDDVRGKVVVIHFWAAGCSSCKEEMPAMEGLYRKFQSRGLAILAINVGQPRAAVKSYLQGLGVSYPIYLDLDARAAREYEVVGVPKTVILDRSGVVRYKILGSATAASLTKLVTSLM